VKDFFTVCILPLSRFGIDASACQSFVMMPIVLLNLL
jgi:hypothetical protein